MKAQENLGTPLNARTLHCGTTEENSKMVELLRGGIPKLSSDQITYLNAFNYLNLQTLMLKQKELTQEQEKSIETLSCLRVWEYITVYIAREQSIKKKYQKTHRNIVIEYPIKKVIEISNFKQFKSIIDDSFNSQSQNKLISKIKIFEKSQKSQNKFYFTDRLFNGQSEIHQIYSKDFNVFKYEDLTLGEINDLISRNILLIGNQSTSIFLRGIYLEFNLRLISKYENRVNLQVTGLIPIKRDIAYYQNKASSISKSMMKNQILEREQLTALYYTKNEETQDMITSLYTIGLEDVTNNKNLFRNLLRMTFSGNQLIELAFESGQDKIKSSDLKLMINSLDNRTATRSLWRFYFNQHKDESIDHFIQVSAPDLFIFERLNSSFKQNLNLTDKVIEYVISSYLKTPQKDQGEVLTIDKYRNKENVFYKVLIQTIKERSLEYILNIVTSLTQESSIKQFISYLFERSCQFYDNKSINAIIKRQIESKTLTVKRSSIKIHRNVKIVKLILDKSEIRLISNLVIFLLQKNDINLIKPHLNTQQKAEIQNLIIIKEFLDTQTETELKKVSKEIKIIKKIDHIIISNLDDKVKSQSGILFKQNEVVGYKDVSSIEHSKLYNGSEIKVALFKSNKLQIIQSNNDYYVRDLKYLVDPQTESEEDDRNNTLNLLYQQAMSFTNKLIESVLQPLLLQHLNFNRSEDLKREISLDIESLSNCLNLNYKNWDSSNFTIDFDELVTNSLNKLSIKTSQVSKHFLKYFKNTHLFQKESIFIICKAINMFLNRMAPIEKELLFGNCFILSENESYLAYLKRLKLISSRKVVEIINENSGLRTVNCNKMSSKYIVKVGEIFLLFTSNKHHQNHNYNIQPIDSLDYLETLKLLEIKASDSFTLK